ncbi:MAG: nuclear transport factor 2 family protein [Chitinophagaceae bacterium]
MKIFLPFIAGCLLIQSCKNSEKADPEKAKKEIEQAEKDFEKMAAEKSIAEAFAYFADSTAVIRGGNDSLIRGKEGIRNLFMAERFKNASVKWAPDFVDVSSSGDLGYTYGKYVWQSKDSTGKTEESKGIFHTVWKKQKDGSWRFVWD